MEFGKIQERNFEEEIQEPSKKLKINQKYGLLLSRLPQDFDIQPTSSLDVCLPKISNRNGGICYLFTSSELEFSELKEKYSNFKEIKVSDLKLSRDLTEKNYLEEFEQIKNFFMEYIGDELITYSSSAKTLQHEPERMKVLCEEAKEYTEQILIKFHMEVVASYQEFSIGDQISNDWDQEIFVGHLILAICCIIQTKVNSLNMMKKAYLFENLNFSYFLKKNNFFSQDQRVFIIDILYQIAFFEDPFNEEEKVHKSIFEMDLHRDSSFFLNAERKDLAEKISKILHSIGKKYFTLIESHQFSNVVSHYIDSIYVGKLNESFMGYTLMNSRVLVSNECILKQKNFKLLKTRGKKVFRLLNDTFLIMISLHEFGHFYQRFENKRKFEWFTFTTPINFINLIQEPPKISSFNSEPLESNPFLTESSQFFTNQPAPELTQQDLEDNSLRTEHCKHDPVIKNLTSNEQKVNLMLPDQIFPDKSLQSDLESELSDSLSSSIKEFFQEIKPKPEGGSLLMTMIFGREPFELNYYDSKFISNTDNWELPEEEFRERYEKEAAKSNPKNQLKIFPHRCRIKTSLFPIVLGRCMKSRI